MNVIWLIWSKILLWINSHLERPTSPPLDTLPLTWPETQSDLLLLLRSRAIIISIVPTWPVPLLSATENYTTAVVCLLRPLKDWEPRLTAIADLKIIPWNNRLVFHRWFLCNHFLISTLFLILDIITLNFLSTHAHTL